VLQHVAACCTRHVLIAMSACRPLLSARRCLLQCCAVCWSVLQSRSLNGLVHMIVAIGPCALTIGTHTCQRVLQRVPVRFRRDLPCLVSKLCLPPPSPPTIFLRPLQWPLKIDHFELLFQRGSFELRALIFEWMIIFDNGIESSES